MQYQTRNLQLLQCNAYLAQTDYTDIGDNAQFLKQIHVTKFALEKFCLILIILYLAGFGLKIESRGRN